MFSFNVSETKKKLDDKTMVHDVTKARLSDLEELMKTKVCCHLITENKITLGAILFYLYALFNNYMKLSSKYKIKLPQL